MTKPFNQKVVRISTTVSIDTAEKYHRWNSENPNEKIQWSECMRKGFYFLMWEKTRADIVEMFDDLPLQVRHKIQLLTDKLKSSLEEIKKLTGEIK